MAEHDGPVKSETMYGFRLRVRSFVERALELGTFDGDTLTDLVVAPEEANLLFSEAERLEMTVTAACLAIPGRLAAIATK